MLYEACIRNLDFDQAQALYRFLVNLSPADAMHGSEGMTWSGIIPGQSRDPNWPRAERIITIQPMRGEDEDEIVCPATDHRGVQCIYRRGHSAEFPHRYERQH